MMIAVRWAAGLALAGLFVAMLGPFQGAEQNFGLTDKAAHVIGFFVVAVCLTLIAPRLGAWRTALLALALGAGVEVIQGFTGRSANPSDLMADAAGIVLASLARAGLERARPGVLNAP